MESRRIMSARNIEPFGGGPRENVWTWVKGVELLGSLDHWSRLSNRSRIHIIAASLTRAARRWYDGLQTRKSQSEPEAIRDLMICRNFLRAGVMRSGDGPDNGDMDRGSSAERNQPSSMRTDTGDRRRKTNWSTTGIRIAHTFTMVSWRTSSGFTALTQDANGIAPAIPGGNPVSPDSTSPALKSTVVDDVAHQLLPHPTRKNVPRESSIHATPTHDPPRRTSSTGNKVNRHLIYILKMW
jgi:hypothetical protein